MCIRDRRCPQRCGRGSGHFGALRVFMGCNQVACQQQLRGLVKAVARWWLAEQAGELRGHLAQFDAVLRALGAGQAGSDVPQVQLQLLGICLLYTSRCV